MKSLRPAHVLAVGYFAYILIGTVFLILPFSQVKTHVSWIDHLFIATSAVSTTGLATIDPGSSYTWFGQFIIFLLFQLGGLGYMTASSFVILAANKKISVQRIKILKSAFALPQTIGVTNFLKHMFIFAFVCEITGALLLYPFLYQAGIDNPFWSAVFHSVSAFCTAGFSLNATSFEAFKESWGVNLILALLSYAGGIGFIVFTDLAAKVKNPKRSLTFTTKVILTFTLAGTVLGTFCIYFLEPIIQGLSFSSRLLAAFFQTMTASTTVGFNTLPISQLALPTVLVLYFLMFFGASPAGTGGGLKSTTLTALIAEAWSHLRGYSKVCLMGRELPDNRVRAASMTATTYVLVLGLGLFFLSIAMPKANFELMVFEAISALGTVGLSMGLTSELNSTGKFIIIALMYIGRIGMVTFGLSFVSQKLLLKHEKTDLAV